MSPLPSRRESTPAQDPAISRIKTKVCLVGGRDTDKTALIRRFVMDFADDRYLITLGMKASKKLMKVPNPLGGPDLMVDLVVCDILGQEGFRDLLKEAYFYGATGILAVCDATRKKTLEDLDDWVQAVFNVTGEIPVVFLANKADLVEQRQVTEENLKTASAPYGGLYFFTSTKTGENVEAAFQTLASQIVARRHRANNSG